MRDRWLVVVALAGCGRFSFGDRPDAAPDADASGLEILIDFSGLVPFVANDFLDGGNQVDNEANAVAALTAPFAPGFAVFAGRSVIELRLDGGMEVHDYRPVVPDMAGPDHVSSGVIANGTGSNALWVSSQSYTAGDGVYVIDDRWAISRDQTNNNTGGVVFDPTGAFDNRGTPTIYFCSGNTGILRRTGKMAFTPIATFQDNVHSLAGTPTALYLSEGMTGAPHDLWRVDTVTHAITQLDRADDISVASGGGIDIGAVGIRDRRELVRYAPDGTRTPIAMSPDPARLWTGAVVPSEPHPLAGRIIVLETDHTSGRDRLLLVPE